MAKPQSDGGGFIQIPNELYRAIFGVGLSGSEVSVLMFIYYQTVGYNHKSRRLSVTYISNGIPMPVDTVRKSLKKLIEKNIVLASSDCSNSPKILSVNKKYKDWRLVQNGRTDLPKTTSQNVPHRLVQNGRTDWYKSTTNTIQKKQYRKNNTECVGTPTKNAAISYFSERGYSADVAEDFFNYYDALGWKVKGSKIQRWEVFADRWMKTEYKDPDNDPNTDVWGNPIKSDEWE